MTITKHITEVLHEHGVQIDEQVERQAAALAMHVNTIVLPSGQTVDCPPGHTAGVANTAIIISLLERIAGDVDWEFIGVTGAEVIGITSGDIISSWNTPPADCNPAPNYVTTCDESETDLGRKARDVRRHWFIGLPGKDQDAIIEPAFDEAHPTDADKREATKRYENAKAGRFSRRP